MATRETDHVLRKRLVGFMKELLQAGTLSGFKYFSLYVRGKEELIVNVVNEPTSCGPSHMSDVRYPLSPGIIPSSPMIMGLHTDPQKPPLPAPSSSFTSGNLPYDKASLMLSQTTQLKLSGYGDEGVGLPPASPSDEENANQDNQTTLFLLACYSRYGCPYVWVRSNHERLIRLNQEANTKDKDNPLKLKSTTNWRNQDLHICDILAEVVKLCAYPPPQNPLAVDFGYLSGLPPSERLLASGALCLFLEKVIINTDSNKIHISHVLEDYQQLMTLHMKTLDELSTSGQLVFSQLR